MLRSRASLVSLLFVSTLVFSGISLADVILEVYAASLVEAGLPKDDLLRLAQTEPVKSKLLANTQGAVDAGVFGSPSFLVGKELFFGKDRLRDVEEAIVARR